MPDIKKISIAMKLARKPDEIARELSALGFETDESSPRLAILSHASSHDIEGKTKSFIRMEFSPDSVVVEYSCHDNESPQKRRIQAVSTVMHALCASGACTFNPSIFKEASEALDDAEAQLSTSLDASQARVSILEGQLDDLKKRNEELMKLREKAANEASESSARLQSLMAAVSKLKNIPDDALDSEVLEHIGAKGGFIDIREFASSRGIPSSVVEESLGRLSSGGYIARIK
jgi:hypothetical protein